MEGTRKARTRKAIKMKAKLVIIISVILLYMVIKCVWFLIKDVRWQNRFCICRELAYYVAENNGVFPPNWTTLTRFSNKRKDGRRFYFEHYEGVFCLPWSENITNTSVMACAWFKSVNKDRQDEDRFFSRFALGDMYSQITNSAKLRSYIDAALEKSGSDKGQKKRECNFNKTGP